MDQEDTYRMLRCKVTTLELYTLKHKGFTATINGEQITDYSDLGDCISDALSCCVEDNGDTNAYMWLTNVYKPSDLYNSFKLYIDQDGLYKIVAQTGQMLFFHYKSDRLTVE